MADAGGAMQGAQVALDLSQVALMLLSGLTTLVVLSLRGSIKDAKSAALAAQEAARKAAQSAQDDAKEDREKFAAKMDALVARWEDKRTACQLEADAKYARRDELDKLHNSVTNNFNAVYTRLRDTEQTATEARAFSSGVEKTVAALCGDK